MTEKQIKVSEVPDEILTLKNSRELAYGENRSQSPAFLHPGDSDDPLAMSKFFPPVAGDPSYIATADGDQIVHILRFLAESLRRNYNGQVPFIVVAGKHANPCGMAIDWDNPVLAIRKALSGDKIAIKGGEVATNFAIDDKLGMELYRQPPEISQGEDKKWELDLIMDPFFSPATIELLGKKEKRRLLANPALEDAPFPEKKWMIKNLYNGNDSLLQKFPNFILTRKSIISWTGEPLPDILFDSLLIAQVAAWNASSNTVALAKNNMLIGLGCGERDRMVCTKICLNSAYRAGHDPRNSVFASDGFFPFAYNTDNNAGKINQLMTAVRLLDANLDGKTDTEKIIILNNFASLVNSLDRREGPELLADAGCIGGVVPADGKRLEEVKTFFQNKKMSVAFVAAENRGFSKH